MPLAKTPRIMNTDYSHIPNLGTRSPKQDLLFYNHLLITGSLTRKIRLEMLREFQKIEKRISSRMSCGSNVAFSSSIMPALHEPGALYCTSNPMRGVSGKTPEFSMCFQVNSEKSKGLETSRINLRQQNRELQLVGNYIPADNRAKVLICYESVVNNTGVMLLTWNWLE